MRWRSSQTTVVSLFHRLLPHATAVVTEGEPCRMKEAGPRRPAPALKDD